MRTILLLLLVTVTSQAQYMMKEGAGAPDNKFGLYASVVSETFYTKNIASSIGLRYKETRIGYYHQSAVIKTEGVTIVRKGFIIEQGLLNVDKCAYLSIGLRVLTTDEDFVSVVPHFTTAFRFKKHFEIPITVSGYEGFTTASIGVRGLF